MGPGIATPAARGLLLYFGLLLVTVLLPTTRTRALSGAGLGLVVLGVCANRAGAGASVGNFSTINSILMAFGTVIALYAIVLAWRERTGPTAAAPRESSRVTPDWLLLAGLLVAFFSPHLILLAAGVFVALVSAGGTAVRSRRGAWLLLIGLGVLLIGAGFVLLFTVLGPYGGRVIELAEGPFSPPAERLLTLLLGFGSLALLGVFPFHRAPWRLGLAPVAMLLAGRILVPALPDGVRDWQAPAMLWLTVAVAAAASQRRWKEVAVAGGMLGIWSGGAQGLDAGRILVLFGWLADGGLLPFQRPRSSGEARWGGVLLLVPAVSIPFLLDSALGTQVLLTVTALASVILGLALEVRLRARAG